MTFLISQRRSNLLLPVSRQWRAESWQRFHRNIRLNIAYVDGVGVTARGSNAFPEGYFKVKSAIRDFFFNLMDQYGIDDYAID